MADVSEASESVRQGQDLDQPQLFSFADSQHDTCGFPSLAPSEKQESQFNSLNNDSEIDHQPDLASLETLQSSMDSQKTVRRLNPGKQDSSEVSCELEMYNSLSNGTCFKPPSFDYKTYMKSKNEPVISAPADIFKPREPDCSEDSSDLCSDDHEYLDTPSNFRDGREKRLYLGRGATRHQVANIRLAPTSNE